MNACKHMPYCGMFLLTAGFVAGIILWELLAW